MLSYLWCNKIDLSYSFQTQKQYLFEVGVLGFLFVSMLFFYVLKSTKLFKNENLIDLKIILVLFVIKILNNEILKLILKRLMIILIICNIIIFDFSNNSIDFQTKNLLFSNKSLLLYQLFILLIISDKSSVIIIFHYICIKM